MRVKSVCSARALIVASIITTHAALLAWIGYVHAPMYDEIAHLPAGVHHWQSGSFDLYRVNPPLVRMVAAIPVVLAGARTDFSEISNDPYSRHEFAVGTRFAERNRDRVVWLFTLSRWACIGFSAIGAWFCYRWANELFGFSSGLIALVLWCFCPNLLAWGATITPDAAASSLGVMAEYGFWRWLRCPDWDVAVIGGVTLGLALLTKSTWIVLLALWPLLWLITRAVTAPKGAHTSRFQEAGQLATMLLIGVYTLNLGYFFEGSFRRLEGFQFVSAALGGRPDDRLTGNRFRGSMLGELRVPLPENYVRGIDLQKHEFEIGKWSYLRGQQKEGGWYHYYLYALAVKTPLGTLGLGALALGLLLASTNYRQSWRNELVLLLPAVAILALVSSQIGFNRYLRYVLPAVPFLYISVSRVGKTLGTARVEVQIATVALLCCSIVGSLNVFPHSMSYFNLAAGGPLGGPAHLLDANIDWGQDLLYLKKWIKDHPDARPFHLQYCGYLDPNIVGIGALAVPKVPKDESAAPRDMGPLPGWHAVSVNDIYGYRQYGHPHEEYTYFQKLDPVDTAGYSIYIYHVSREDANRLRQMLGLPLLRTTGVSKEM